MQGSRFPIVKIMCILFSSLIICMYSISYALAVRDRNWYPSNIYWGNISLSSYPKDNLDIMELTAAWGDKIQLYSPLHKQTFALPINDCGINFDYAASLASIQKYDLDDNRFLKLINHVLIRGEAHNAAPILLLNSADKLRNQLKLLSAELTIKPVSAAVTYHEEKLDKLASQSGYQLDLDASLNRIDSGLKEGGTGPWELQFQEVQPHVNTQDTNLINDLLAYDITSRQDFGNGEKDSFTAVQSINGTVILARETFSLLAVQDNETFSSDQNSVLNYLRSIFEKALLNAEIDKDVQIDHTGNALILTNKMEYPLAVTIKVNPDTTELKIWGKQEDGKNFYPVEEESKLPIEREHVIDYQLPTGQEKVQQEGTEGRKVQIYGVIEKGQQTKRHLISETIEPGVKEIVSVGPVALEK